jgi:hypothetical protein
MFYELMKLIAGIVVVVAFGIIFLMVIKANFKSASTTLYRDGFILTNPTRNAVAFENSIDAKRYVNECSQAGIKWRCYEVVNGHIIERIWT